MDKIFIAIDGSCLFFQILEIWRKNPKLNKRKIKLGKLSEALNYKFEVEGKILRTVYYFKKGDSRIKEMLDIPDINKPGQKNKWLIDECGISIRSLSDTELMKISASKRDVFPRKEKGLDIKLTCDSLSLLSTNRASTIILLINDRDYLPLFKAIQNLGGNVYLLGLHSDLAIRKQLKEDCDRFITLDDEIEGLFGLEKSPETSPPQELRI